MLVPMWLHLNHVVVDFFAKSSVTGGREVVFRKILGETIRGRRKRLSLSQERLAELVNCHRNYVGNVERGEQNLTVDMLIRFAKALKVKTSVLIAGLPN